MRTGACWAGTPGVHRFTIGQRKGLGVAGGSPLFVVNLDAGRKLVTVGAKPLLDRAELSAASVNWIGGTPPADPVRVAAQIRHRHPAAPATVTATGDDTVRVVFDEPQTAVTPGQAVVFYRGDEVLGGGWIDSSR
jgi:tRNA-uridine 2-sulfurtransferase